MYGVQVLVEVFNSYYYPVYISSLTTQLLTIETSEINTQYISMLLVSIHMYCSNVTFYYQMFLKLFYKSDH